MRKRARVCWFCAVLVAAFLAVPAIPAGGRQAQIAVLHVPELEAGVEPGPRGLLSLSLGEHRGAEIHPGDPHSPGQSALERERHVPASRGKVEDASGVGAAHRADQAMSPINVDSAAQDPVCEVVSAGYPAEHGIHRIGIRHVFW